MANLLLALFALVLPCVTSQILDLTEGSSCKTLYGDSGTCTLLRRCKEPGDFKRQQPPICSFTGKEPIICCPNQLFQRLKVGLRAAQYCKRTKSACSLLRKKRQVETTTQRTHNGTKVKPSLFKPPKQFVVGGKISKPRIRKYMALIGFGPAENKEWGCGGSLINSRFVLSAAHCSDPEILGPARWARVGDLDISTEKDDARVQDLEIVERIVHPEYRKPQVYNDIVLFKLYRDVDFTAWVNPVCLHTDRTLPWGEATVTGWGRIDFAGETSSKLLEADLNIFNDTECSRLVSQKDKKTPRGIDSDLMFCAGKRDGSKDACSGDSGGPLVVSKPNECLNVQIGITSFGSQCGLPDSPGVYTRVSQYIPWIENIVFFNETPAF